MTKNSRAWTYPHGAFCLNGAEAVSAERSGSSVSGSALVFSASRRSTPCYGMAEASLAVTFKPAGMSFKTLGVDGENWPPKG